MGLTESPLCSYCHLENENIQHLFFSCQIAQNLWLDIKTFFSSKLTVPNLSLQCAIFGFLDQDKNINYLTLNNILIMYKITLYRNRDKNNIRLQNVIKNLKSKEKIEKSIAFEKNKLEFNKYKWNDIYELITP